ncbi:MAG: DHH family phosphoesterase [bacterium]|nr:DHH family phosphoesterase [bacterium]
MKYQISNIKSLTFAKASAGKPIPNLIKIILENRGLKTKKEIEEFLNPKLENINIKSVGINSANLKKAIERIKLAIKNKEQIVVFGDYDVDGICGTAILWETLNSIGAKVMPYIPHRIDEGYGLSIAGINNVILNLFQDPKHKSKEMLKQDGYQTVTRQVQHDTGGGLIITVDNGIVANKAVEFAKEKGIDVIITDHHVPSKVLPKALAIVHTTKLCGTGIAYLLSEEMLKQVQHDNGKHLGLVALATVADLVPLKGANRTLLKFGLEALKKTKRVGLLELFKEAGLDKNSIGVYQIGHMIAPRLNAMGRLEYAMDSLRLICTNNQKRAENLAHLLGATNKERQDITLQTVLHAIEGIRNKKQENYCLFLMKVMSPE